MLSFIHLSDIHFQKYSGDPYDIDSDLRDELLNDISNEYKRVFSSADGILVCGDIAFSAEPQQYEIASSFLSSICEILSLDKSKVFCVPGNHDVDRNVTKGQLRVSLMQQELDQLPTCHDYDDTLSKIFRTPEDADTLYAPISCYIEKFAAQFGCDFANRPIWTQKMSIDGKYKLIIWGMNSTIISNESDHITDDTERKMRISQIQIPHRVKNAVYLSLCHHPPECWHDPDKKLSEKMNARVTIQLYGHKHIQTVSKMTNSIIVGSGATHPPRSEKGWLPRYNWISVGTQRIGTSEFLRVRIYPRVLDDIEDKFGPDKCPNTGNDYFEYSFCLDAVDCDLTDTCEADKCEEATMPSTLQVESWERKFMYDFINLPYTSRDSIMKELGLFSPEDDEGKKHTELILKIIERATKQECVSKLLDRVAQEKERIEKK